MDQQEQKERILEFMKANLLTVISTIDVENNKPEAACIAFAEKKNLDLIFGTSNKSRKYKNFQANKNVSFVIGWTDEFGTIQYEGIASELLGDEAIRHGEIMSEKNKNCRVFLTKESQRYFLVKPTWIRFVDKSIKPEEKIEVEL